MRMGNFTSECTRSRLKQVLEDERYRPGQYFARLVMVQPMKWQQV